MFWIAQAYDAAVTIECRRGEDFYLLRMIFSENRFPSRIKSGTGFFGIMRYLAGRTRRMRPSPVSVSR